MIKILHYGLTNHLGGIETYLYKLATNINSNIFQFDFLILGEDKPCYYEELKAMGCNFHFVTKRTENTFKNKKDIDSLLKTEKYDVVHCHLNSLSYITPVLSALKLRIPTIVHSRNAGIPKSIKSRILHYINFQRLPMNKIKMLAVSDYAGEWMFGEHKNFTVINNGIETEKYQFNKETRLVTRKDLGIGENELAIIHTGALREQKNHDFLLDIFAEVTMNNPNTKLILVGSGVLESKIKEKISYLKLTDKVIMTGQRMDIPELLTAGDMYLFPSLYEGFPNSVIEAETSGLPCLISDTITQEVVINDNCKQKSLNDSAKDWATELISLSSVKFDRVKARKKIETSGFSVNTEIVKIEKEYLNLTKN